jgi:drug/metabolite transporter (DMT)-like permease
MRRLAELALVGIAAVWGLTFVMVQDAIEHLDPMAFLAYRFLPAAALVGLAFWRPLRGLSPAGWRAGIAMGAFLTAGYVAQTLGLEHTTASNAGFITGLFVVLTPVLGALFWREEIGASGWVAAGVSAVGLLLLSGTGGALNVSGDGVVFLCACAFAAHILVTARAVPHHHVGALVAVQLAVCGAFLGRASVRCGLVGSGPDHGRHSARRRRPTPPPAAAAARGLTGTPRVCQCSSKRAEESGRGDLIALSRWRSVGLSREPSRPTSRRSRPACRSS